MKARILIVGGGAMGTCIALHAASRCDPLREPVILIEKESLGAGSSGRSPAIVHQGYSDRTLAGMARDALKVYAGLERTTGRSVGYRRTGVLGIVGPSDGPLRAALEEEIRMQVSIGIDVRRVGDEEIRAIAPGIQVAGGSIGAWEPDGGFVDAGRAIEAFATLARDRGATTRIGGADPEILVEGGRAVGVKTSAGTFHAPQIVLATGPWTSSILAPFGIDLPLRVVRTEQHFLAMPTPQREADEDDRAPVGESASDFETRFLPDPLDKLPVAHPVILDHEHRFQARCEPSEGRTRVSRLGFEHRVEIRDFKNLTGEVDAEFPRWAREAITRRLPVYADRKDLGSLVSSVTLTPDQRPILGPVRGIEGLFVVTGFTGNDFQLAPSIGEGMAQMLMGEPVSAFDPESFSPARFHEATS